MGADSFSLEDDAKGFTGVQADNIHSISLFHEPRYLVIKRSLSWSDRTSLCYTYREKKKINKYLCQVEKGGTLSKVLPWKQIVLMSPGHLCF